MLEIKLTKSFIAEVRESFRVNILDGERHLHLLAHSLSSRLLEGDFELHSDVHRRARRSKRPPLLDSPSA